MKPWVCPKCGKVYGPTVMECHSCNHGPVALWSTNYPPGWQPPIKRATIEMAR